MMPFSVIQGDITEQRVDVIVNAANSHLRMGGGVCGAIFSAAGAESLQAACNRIGMCKTGEAVLTDAFALPAKYVIHTVGPVWRGGMAGEARLLRNCYLNSLRLAAEHGCRSVAFPLISSGIYGYPKEEALTIATNAVEEFLKHHEMTVYLVLYNKD